MQVPKRHVNEELMWRVEDGEEALKPLAIRSIQRKKTNLFLGNPIPDELADSLHSILQRCHLIADWEWLDNIPRWEQIRSVTQDMFSEYVISVAGRTKSSILHGRNFLIDFTPPENTEGPPRKRKISHDPPIFAKSVVSLFMISDIDYYEDDKSVAQFRLYLG
jgi:hypothetical protein